MSRRSVQWRRSILQGKCNPENESVVVLKKREDALMLAPHKVGNCCKPMTARKQKLFDAAVSQIFPAPR